jgi:hypothetical protein
VKDLFLESDSEPVIQSREANVESSSYNAKNPVSDGSKSQSGVVNSAGRPKVFVKDDPDLAIP